MTDALMTIYIHKLLSNIHRYVNVKQCVTLKTRFIIFINKSRNNINLHEVIVCLQYTLNQHVILHAMCYLRSGSL